MATGSDEDRAPEEAALLKALERIVGSCPRLAASCYWAGTSCIAIEELHHRRSFDLDFHTRRALQDVRPLATEIARVFGSEFRLTSAPDEHGSGFRGSIGSPGGQAVTVEVLSNFQDVPSMDLVPSGVVPGIRRITLRRYLADKVQCLVERTEARDLVDVAAAVDARPELAGAIRVAMAAQDGVILTERLQAWTDDGIARDLAAYEDVDPRRAMRMRDTLLGWIREGEPFFRRSHLGYLPPP